MLNKIIPVLAGVLITILAVLGYLFYNSLKDVKGDWRKIFSQQTTEITDKKSNVPPGTEIPLNRTGPDSIPIATYPQNSGTNNDANPLPSPEMGNNENQGKPVSIETADWKTYTNKKYNYSFKYPKEYDYSSCDKDNPCKYGQVYEKDGGDLAWLNGATNNQNWPFINVIHYDNESYTLPDKVKFFDWLQQKMGWTKDKGPKDFNLTLTTSKGDPKKAMRVSVPQTPQGYAREEIYYENNNKIFQIQFIDTNKPAAQEFYNSWLSKFVIN